MTAVFTAMTNTLKTTLLLGALSALLLLIGEVLGGAQGLLIAFLFAAGTNFVSYFYSDKIVLSMYRHSRSGPASAVRHGGAACRTRGFATCPGCTSSRQLAQRVCHGAQPAARGRRCDRGHPARARPGRTDG